MANLYERESVEFQPVDVKLAGVSITESVSFSIVPDGDRPVTFVPAGVYGGKAGVMIQGLGPGTYRIFAKVNNSPEVPVIDCGYFYVN